MSQFSDSVTELPNISQIPCDTLEEHKGFSELCLWVHGHLTQYTRSQKGFFSPWSTGGRRTGAISLSLVYVGFSFPPLAGVIPIYGIIEFKRVFAARAA